MHPSANSFNNTFSLQFEQEALYFHFALEPTHYVTLTVRAHVGKWGFMRQPSESVS